MPTDFIAANVAPNQGATLTLGGLLSKVAEAGIDVARSRALGESMPSSAPVVAGQGQNNPERVEAGQDVPAGNSAQLAAQRLSAYLPWIVGGGIVVAIILAAAALRRR